MSLEKRENMKRVITLIFLFAIIMLANETHAQVLLQKKHHQKVLSNSAKKPSKASKSIKTFSAITKQLPTRIENHFWDSLSNDWIKEYESVVTYNSKNLPTLEMMYDLNGNEVYRALSTYDSKNKLIEYLTEYKANNTWVGNEKYVYEYDANDELILSEEWYYSGISWELSYGTKKLISKDPVNNTTSITTLENYDLGYDTTEKYIYYYDQNNLVLAEQYYQYQNGTGFYAYEQYEYLYDQNNVDTGMIKSTWDGSNWEPQYVYCNYTWNNQSKEFLASNNIYYFAFNGLKLYQRETYTRDANGSFSYLLEDKTNSGLWRGNMRINIVNDEHRNRVLYDYDVDYGNGWMQLFLIEEEYTYDATGNMTSHIYRESDFNGVLLNKYKLLFSNFINATGIKENKFLELKTFPNPCTEFLKVEHASLNEKEYVIYNLGGQIIQSGIIRSQKINTTELSNGYYILNTDKYQAVFIKK